MRRGCYGLEEHACNAFGEPYTLDEDQVRAVIDDHQNTLVIARAGSGKTRVIVAKVAYLVAHCGYQFSEIAVLCLIALPPLKLMNALRLIKSRW